MSFEKPEDWSDMVQRIDTAEAFEAVARAMFADGKVTNDRMLVLEVFARDVAEVHPTIATRVMRHYIKLWREQNNHYKMLCWLHSKYDFPIVLQDVVEGLLAIMV